MHGAHLHICIRRQRCSERSEDMIVAHSDKRGDALSCAFRVWQLRCQCTANPLHVGAYSVSYILWHTTLTRQLAAQGHKQQRVRLWTAAAATVKHPQQARAKHALVHLLIYSLASELADGTRTSQACAL
jgi:hypothetical protein